MTPSRVRRVTALAVVGAVAVTACGGGDESGSVSPVTATAGTTEPAAAEPEVAEAPEVLRFSAPTVGGGELDLAAFGDRPVLLWFWAPF